MAYVLVLVSVPPSAGRSHGKDGEINAKTLAIAVVNVVDIK